MEHVDRLADRAAGRRRVATADGSDAGWSAGGSVLDTAFSLEKNVIGDALAFAYRTDTDRLPGDLLHAYYLAELTALAKDNPSGNPSARQKREAKSIARERMEEEAKDGRYRKRKCAPVLWDRVGNEVLFGATSPAQIDGFTRLFKDTFGVDLDAVTAGPLAYRLADLGNRGRVVDDATPSAFVAGRPPEDVCWIADGQSRDWLGNEFLAWLWFETSTGKDTFALGDESEATVMFSGSLTVECPRGQTGTDTFRHENPTRLPEACRALALGKLPRRAGLVVVRHDRQFEFTLSAEHLAVSGAKLPKPDDDAKGREIVEARVGSLRSLVEVLDLLYAAFLDDRLGIEWPDTMDHVRRWLSARDRKAA